MPQPSPSSWKASFLPLSLLSNQEWLQAKKLYLNTGYILEPSSLPLYAYIQLPLRALSCSLSWCSCGHVLLSTFSSTQQHTTIGMTECHCTFTVLLCCCFFARIRIIFCSLSFPFFFHIFILLSHYWLCQFFLECISGYCKVTSSEHFSDYCKLTSCLPARIACLNCVVWK